MKKLKIAIVGASGLVGEKILQCLVEEKLDTEQVRLFVSKRSAGKSVMFREREMRFELLSENAAAEKFDIVFFSAGDDISRMWAEKFAASGAYVIDNSNAFRRDDDKILVVPEINTQLISAKTRIISNPNCSTIQLAMALRPLLALSETEKIVVSTYQSVSGAGRAALLDLFNHTDKEIPEMICGNVIEKIGKIEENGYCTEENKIMFEMNKIFGKNLQVCASTVRVPVPYCHTESVFVEFTRPVSAEAATAALKSYNIIVDETLSLPSKIADTNAVHVCRIRNFGENCLTFFVVADNLRRGAAFNAVKIARFIAEKIL